MLLQHVTLECLGGRMCWCVSLVLCVSAAPLMMKGHGGMGHFVIKCSIVTQVVTLTGCIGLGLHGVTAVVEFIGKSYIIQADNQDQGGDVWYATYYT